MRGLQLVTFPTRNVKLFPCNKKKKKKDDSLLRCSKQLNKAAMTNKQCLTSRETRLTWFSDIKLQQQNIIPTESRVNKTHTHVRFKERHQHLKTVKRMCSVCYKKYEHLSILDSKHEHGHEQSMSSRRSLFHLM